MFGHKQEEGFFLKHRFVHPKLKITFPLIDDFYFINTPKKIIGINNKNSQIIYDIVETNNIELEKYLVSWSKKAKVKIDKLDSFSLNNLEFSIGEAKVKDDQLIFVAARDSDGNYIHRFILVSKKGIPLLCPGRRGA